MTKRKWLIKMEIFPSSFLISLDLKAFASDFLPDFFSFIIIRVKCPLECHMHFCHDINSLRATLCHIYIHMSHNALNIVKIQYIFMEQVDGPVLCEAIHRVGIENISFQAQANGLLYKSDKHSREGKWLHLISASLDGLIDASPVAMWQRKRFLHKVSGF